MISKGYHGKTWYPYFFYVWRDKMADKQQLVYEINVVEDDSFDEFEL